MFSAQTFEGHESAVLKMEFLSRGMQILSSGSDGLLKLWCIKTAECITTLDQHNNRVWSLAGELCFMHSNLIIYSYFILPILS